MARRPKTEREELSSLEELVTESLRSAEILSENERASYERAFAPKAKREQAMPAEDEGGQAE